MPENAVDTEGVFRFEVVESGVNVTTNGNPKWVAKLRALEKFVTSDVELEHFGLDAAAWVDYSSFDQFTYAHLVLFKVNDKDKDEALEPGVNSLPNYEQLQVALGWDGSSFDDLSDTTFVGKTFQGRMKEDEYKGKVRCQLAWIDAFDADPSGGIKTLDSAAVKKLSARLTVSKKGRKVAKAV